MISLSVIQSLDIHSSGTTNCILYFGSLILCNPLIIIQSKSNQFQNVCIKIIYYEKYLLDCVWFCPNGNMF